MDRRRGGRVTAEGGGGGGNEGGAEVEKLRHFVGLSELWRLGETELRKKKKWRGTVLLRNSCRLMVPRVYRMEAEVSTTLPVNVMVCVWFDTLTNSFNGVFIEFWVKIPIYIKILDISSL